MSTHADRSSSDDRVRDILYGYKTDAELGSFYHEHSSRIFRFADKCFALPVKVLPFISTSLMVPALSGSEAPWYFEYAAAFCTVATGVLSIVRGVFHFDERSVLHRTACLDYGELRRELTYFLARRHASNEIDAYAEIAEHRIGLIIKSSPDVPLRVQRIVDSQMASKSHHSRLTKKTLITQANLMRTPLPTSRKNLVRALADMQVDDLRMLFTEKRRTTSGKNSEHTSISEDVEVLPESGYHVVERAPEDVVQQPMAPLSIPPPPGPVELKRFVMTPMKTPTGRTTSSNPHTYKRSPRGSNGNEYTFAQKRADAFGDATNADKPDLLNTIIFDLRLTEQDVDDFVASKAEPVSNRDVR